MMRNNHDIDSILPWIIVIIVIIVCFSKTNDSRVCIIGSSGLNQRFNELFENDSKVTNRLTSYLQRENLFGCHDVFILEPPDKVEIFQTKNTEYFMFLLELYDAKHLFRGIIPGEMNYEEAQELIKS